MELRLRREIEPRRGTFSQFRLNVQRTLGCRVTGGPCMYIEYASYRYTYMDGKTIDYDGSILLYIVTLT